jgi:hypothetical protein
MLLDFFLGQYDGSGTFPRNDEILPDYTESLPSSSTRRRNENLKSRIKINSFSRILNKARETKKATTFSEF